MSHSIEEQVAASVVLIKKQFPTGRNIKYESMFNVLSNSLTCLSGYGKIEKATSVIMVIRYMLETGIIDVVDGKDGLYDMKLSIKTEEIKDIVEHDEDEDEDEYEEPSPSISEDTSPVISPIDLSNVVYAINRISEHSRDINSKLDKVIELAIINNSLVAEQTKLLCNNPRKREVSTIVHPNTTKELDKICPRRPVKLGKCHK